MRALWLLLWLLPSVVLAQPKSPPPPAITGSTPTSGHCVEWTGPHSYADAGASCGSGGAVNVVANSDGTLTISPTTGSVVASIALGHANTWTGAQTFVAPALGTPTSLILTNATGLPIAGVTGWGTNVAAALANPLNGSGGLLGQSLLGTSGGVLGLLNGNLTFSGNDTFSGTVTFASVNGAGNVQSGATYTLAATDCGKTLLFTDNSAVTVTIAASIAPTSGTICTIAILQGGTAKVSVNGSAVSAATLVSAHSYTGTSGTSGSVIDLVLTTVSATATAYLTGDGS